VPAALDALDPKRARQRWLLRNALLLLSCAVAARLGVATAEPHSLVATFAPAVGLAWVAAMRWGPALAPGAWLGLALGLLWSGASPLLAIAIATGQCLGALVAAFWLGRAGFDARMEQPRDLWVLAGAVLCGGLVLSAANAASWLLLAGRIPLIDLAGAWLGWWFSEVTGLVLVGVALLALPRPLERPSRPVQRWIGDAALLLGMALSLAVVVNALAAGRLDLLPFALLPMVALAWLTLRGGLLLPALSLAAMALVAAILHATASRPMPELVATLGLRSLWACLAAAQALVLLVHVFAGRSDNAARRYELALESADIGVAEWPLRAGMAYTSPRWRTLLGDPDGSRTATLDGWLARVHGDDRSDLRAAIETLDAPEHRSVWRQARIRVGDAWPWFELRIAVVERDADHRPLRLVATLSDVQEQRSAEDRERLSTSLFQNLHEGLVIVDAELRILDVNPTYSRITGIPRDELIGTVPTLLSSRASSKARSGPVCAASGTGAARWWSGGATAIRVRCT
jgi:PAS domain-containing protein